MFTNDPHGSRLPGMPRHWARGLSGIDYDARSGNWKQITQVIAVGLKY